MVLDAGKNSKVDTNCQKKQICVRFFTDQMHAGKQTHLCFGMSCFAETKQKEVKANSFCNRQPVHSLPIRCPVPQYTAD